MDVQQFENLVSGLTSEIANRPLGRDLQDHLNAKHGPGSASYQALFEACKSGVAAGWLCQREAGGIRYGRAIKPGPATHGFSVDVVDMKDIKGPHHSHPNGEIDLIMPLTDGAHFDGHPAGWCVYEAGSAHHPTVSEGQALVLYLLPGGAIEFSRAASAQ